MNLCKDCKHYDAKDRDGYWAKCHHPKTCSVDLVTGESKGEYCSSQRKWDWLRTRVPPATCGKEARWFEPK